MSFLANQYESSLQKISALKWFPWIGSAYPNLKRKLLIVGESQYAIADTPDDFEKDFNVVNSKDFTRNAVLQTQIENHYKHKPLDNLLKALFGNSPIDKQKLWQKISFYNFIQRVMDYRVQERPTIADFDQGWEVFVEVVKILQPTDVIFIGVEAATSFERMMDKINISRSERILLQKIGDTAPRIASIKVNGVTTNISFIKHSSAHFSPSDWGVFLQSRHQEVILELK